MDQRIRHEKDPRKAIVYLPEGTTEFTSKNGKMFFVETNVDELTAERFELMDKHLIQVGFATTFDSLLTNLRQTMSLVKKQETHDAHVILYNIVAGMMDKEKKYPFSLWLATVFIYMEGEDVFEWNETLARQKIEIWRKEYDMSFFLGLSISLLAKYKSVLESISLILLDDVGTSKDYERQMERAKRKIWDQIDPNPEQGQ